MTEAIHPGHTAVNLHRQYATYRGLQLEKRATAADLRKRAKAAPLKVDAFQMRKQAKPLSEEAANAGANAGRALKDFLQKAQEAQQMLTARMPPRVASLGCDEDSRIYQRAANPDGTAHTQAPKA